MSEGKRYFWLKLYEDFFTSKRIKKLRSIAGGDTYTIIYLKMQLKALKTEGYLYFDGVMEDFSEELALDIDENADDVRMTIQYLLSVGLLESNVEDTYRLTYMNNVIGSETASAQRVRDFRERKKKEKTLHCNADETQVKQVGSAEIEKEKEIEIEIEKDICAEQPETIITFLLIDGTEYGITDVEYQGFCEAYPNVNVLQELKKAKMWCVSNPRRRKTDKGIMRFLNNWLSKAQSELSSGQMSMIDQLQAMKEV